MQSFLSKAQFFKDIFYRFSQAFLKQFFHLIIVFYGIYVIGAESFGKYAYIGSILVLFSIFSDFGFSLAIAKSLSEDEDNKKYIFSDIFSLLLFFSLFFSVISFFVVFHVYPGDYLISTLSFLLVFLTPFVSFFDGVNRGFHDFSINLKAGFYSSLVAIFVLFTSIEHLLIAGLMFSQVIFASVFVFISGRKNLKLCFFKLKPYSHMEKGAKDIFRYSIVLGFASLGQFLYTKVDILVLGYYGFYDEIALYESLDRIFIYLVLPFGLVGQVLAPRVINSEKYKSHYMFFSLLVVCVAMVISIVLLASYHVLNIDKFLVEIYDIDSFYFILVMLVIILPIRAFSIFQTQAYLAPLGFASIIAKSTIFFGLANLILDFLLIRKFGFEGVFMSTLLVVTLNTLVQTIYYKVKF